MELAGDPADYSTHLTLTAQDNIYDFKRSAGHRKTFSMVLCNCNVVICSTACVLAEAVDLPLNMLLITVPTFLPFSAAFVTKSIS